jgi:hypothetical protein
MILDDDIQLGGQYSPLLLDMTPRGLVEAFGMMDVATELPDGPPLTDGELPVSVRKEDTSRNRDHWRKPIP